MAKPPVHASILEICSKVTAKRPRAVIDHILKHGAVTTEDLQDLGYDHAPRAARDVRELGIPLLTSKSRSTRSGRMIAQYSFGDPTKIVSGRLAGRKAIPKRIKSDLLTRFGAVDNLTGQAVPESSLTVDHRVPYEVAGDSDDMNSENFMLLDGSSQRRKSWACEHCENFRSIREPEICLSCYWASPEEYDHVATAPVRRVDVYWSGDEVAEYDLLKKISESGGESPSDLVKAAVTEYLQKAKQS